MVSADHASHLGTLLGASSWPALAKWPSFAQKAWYCGAAWACVISTDWVTTCHGTLPRPIPTLQLISFPSPARNSPPTSTVRGIPNAKTIVDAKTGQTASRKFLSNPLCTDPTIANPSSGGRSRQVLNLAPLIGPDNRGTSLLHVVPPPSIIVNCCAAVPQSRRLRGTSQGCEGRSVSQTRWCLLAPRAGACRVPREETDLGRRCLPAG